MKVQIEKAVLVRETEKALLLNVAFGDEFRKDVWFPKSQVEARDGAFFAPEWLLAAKADEVGSNAPSIAFIPAAVEVVPVVDVRKSASRKISRAGGFN